MRTFLSLLIVVITFSLQAQGGSYTMYETVIIEPDTEDLAGLSEAMAEHNKTFHNEGPHSAVVWQISTGPNIGKLVWMMGPLTYSDLDTRPAGEHDDHWMSAVLPHVESMSNGEYWRRADDMSNTETDPTPMVAVRYLEVNRGMSDKLMPLLKKVSDAVKATDASDPFSIYVNEFQQGYDIGRHVAIVNGISSWAEFDEEDTFQEDYEKHHGEGSWEYFMWEWDEVIANSWDEIWTLMPNLSGPSTD